MYSEGYISSIFLATFERFLDKQDGELCMPDDVSDISTTIEELIFLVRGQKVMFDQDLAQLYGVETRILTRAVRRNLERFPSDFMFELSDQEVIPLRSQIGISKIGSGGRRYNPMVFTEQGIAMLSTVLRSSPAVKVNIEIMRTFVKLRSLIGRLIGVLVSQGYLNHGLLSFLDFLHPNSAIRHF